MVHQNVATSCVSAGRPATGKTVLQCWRCTRRGPCAAYININQSLRQIPSSGHYQLDIEYYLWGPSGQRRNVSDLNFLTHLWVTGSSGSGGIKTRSGNGSGE